MLGSVRPRIALAVVLAVLALAAAFVAWRRGDVTAQTAPSVREGDAILHEYVPGLASDEGATLVSRGGSAPEAIVYDGELISAPEGGALRERERAMQALPSAAGAGQTAEAGRPAPSFRPDRVTALHGEVGYYEVFTPGISPFKRVTALDRLEVGRDGVPVLRLTSAAPRQRVTVVGASAPPPDARPRDRFWGSVVLDFTEGPTVPFPSVSPESQVLSMRVEPDVMLHLERDAADNFFAVLDVPGAATEVRVVFLTDAPRSYFGGQLSSAPVGALAHEVEPLPPALARRALEVAAVIGVDPSMRWGEAVSRLTEHFRSFEESEVPPSDTGDIYRDLALGRRGVCRHRAYGFVVTARALGISARFVQNEAHAWVELHVPDGLGWIRVDLGGAAQGLRTHGPHDRPTYRSAERDPLPRPPEYLAAYAAAASMSERGGAGGEGGEGATRVAPGPASPGRARVEMGTAPSDGRAPLTLRLESRSSLEVMRGQEVEIAGSASSAGRGVAGLRIEVLLASEGAARERLLGVTVTDSAGLFHGHFGVPPDTVVGTYTLVVRSPGDANVGPAFAL